ncbi:ragulator complex protein LAMTOR2 [Eurytemora carolleeae]|uniref:ragulator complex protein LAMTOR2 n=1 Tax=Eurytemora carolleeae TaxID=1294199 RepID=UPI000C76BD10|nr:ragulator complex protein LAMTOR2 [Eurytemora carolleeae]|eukprot:XP_023337521.1 ragulator complex protein LAMTOR2-like [Eurytemora affinis]
MNLHSRFTFSVKMLKPRVLTEVLAQVTMDGVESSFLFKVDGTLIAHYCLNSSPTDPRVGSAIASNIWSIYHKNGRGSLDEDKLQMVLMENQGGRIVIKHVNNLVICLCSNTSVELGMLTKKCDALVEYLQEPLSKVTL